MADMPEVRLKSEVVVPKLVEIQLLVMPFVRRLNENEASSFSRAKAYAKWGLSRNRWPVLSAL